MNKPTIQRAKIVIEAIHGSIFLVIYRYQPNAFIYLKMSVFDTLMRNDGNGKFYRIRQHLEKNNEYYGKERSGVLGRWCSKRGLFEMAHGKPGEPLDKVENAVRIDTFFVNVADIRRFKKMMEVSTGNKDGLRKVTPGPFALL